MDTPDYKSLYEKERQWRYDHTALVVNRLDIVEDKDQCEGCGGSGIKVYSTTGTYRTGVGGCTPTGDVCDKCWGSGRASKAWPSHRSITMDDLGYEEGEECGLKGCDGLLESDRTAAGWSDAPCIGDGVSCPICGREVNTSE